jgi:hypothetical protein
VKLYDISRAVLEGGNFAYSVYNDGNAAVTLRITPKPAYLSLGDGYLSKRPAAFLSKAGAGGAWQYTVRPSTEQSGELAGVTVGASENEHRIPVAPSFSSQSVVLVDEESGYVMGHHLTPELARGGRAFKLRFINKEKQKAAFTFSLEASAGVPANMQAAFVSAATGQAIGGGPGYTVTVGGNSYEDVYMVLGSRDYLNKSVSGGPAGAKFVMGRVSVNQAARSASIKYYIPFAGVDKVEVSVYNLKGKMVWKNAQKVKPAMWNTVEWKSRESRGGSVAAGLYIIRVRAVNVKGATTAVENRRITFAR